MTSLRLPRFVCCALTTVLLFAACAPESSVDLDEADESDTSAEDDQPRRDAGTSRDASRANDGSRSSRDASASDDDEGDESEPSTSVREPDPAASKSSLLPFKEGNTWTYRVTGGSSMQMKVTTVGAMEKVGGTGPNKDKMAFKVTTTKGSDRTVSWQAVVGASVLRYREIAYSASSGMAELEEHWAPHKLHVHSDAEHTKAGAKWVETYQETKVMMGGAPMTDTSADNWSVDAPKVSVTVAAGTFDAVVLVKASPSGNKTYWYVPGVGKVKETGGQTEELVSFELAP